MKLKSFTAFGFKSFADKTELHFDRGITAIVGPNGSGKSNISDAITWVLGEQSAKYLRGGKMEDVIFSGTAKRRQLGMAEVSLTFDNSDRQLPLEFEEVCLTRRLYRSGDSDYQINKKPVRLKDILDLMADTGLGKGSMSIIGQNKIDGILNARPEERRTIFEEAAGIAKYRMRKKDAVRRLEETGVNLARINDIRVEVDNQVEPLRVAAEKTLRFNELDGRLKQVRLTGFMRKIDGIGEVRQKLQDKQQLLLNELTARQAELARREAQMAELQQQVDKLSEDFAVLQGVLTEKQSALERLKGDIGVLRERSDQSNRNLLRLEEKNKNLAEQLKNNQQVLQTVTAEFDKEENSFSALQLQAEALQHEKEAAQQELGEAQKAQEQAEGSFFAGMQELLQLRSELESLEKAQDERMKQREGLKETVTALENEAQEAERRGRSASDELARREREQGRIRQELDVLAAKYAREQDAVRRESSRKQEAEQRLALTETRLTALQRMQENYDGFNNGIRTVLKSQADWRTGLVGVVAELLTVPPHLVAAIETALGEGAQNIVTRDSNTAKAAIRYLKDQKGGRATFLPLDTVQPRTLQQDELALGRLPGVLGFALDLVQWQPEAERALRFLLGRVLVADNLDSALAAAKAGHFRFKVVTLDGDVVNAGGSLTGGVRRQREGYLSREKLLQELQQQAEGINSEILTAQEALEAAEEGAKVTGRQVKTLTEQFEQESLKVKELQLETANCQRVLNDVNQRLGAALGERTAVAEAYMAQRDRVKELRGILAEREAGDAGAKEQLDVLKQRLAKAGTQLTVLENRLGDVRVQLESGRAKREYLAQRMQDLDGLQSGLQADMQKNGEEAGRLQSLVEECNSRRQELQDELERRLADLAVSAGSKELFLQQRGELQSLYDEAGADAQESRRSVAAAEAKVHQAEMELTRQNADYDHALEQLGLEYNLTIEQAHEAELLQESNKELARLERSLTTEIMDLGPINPGAVEEYNAVRERAEFLQKQYQDLAEAKEKLEGIIAEINTGMSTKFKSAFAQINGHFAECYKQLFGGGTAVLRLADSENVLESGIEIEAQPPGKKLQGLFLLSGGERALTVIALLFALLSYRPSPFCILDEIDAPLDDANIGRFSAFLHNFARNTQFIVITHRKGTMESADIMYGVTMQESGVSKLLSVKINEGTEEA